MIHWFWICTFWDQEHVYMIVISWNMAKFKKEKRHHFEKSRWRTNGTSKISFFFFFCVIFVLYHFLSYFIRFLDLENVYLDTKNMCMGSLLAEMSPILRKNSGHFENPRWRPKRCWKKCQHCFSNSQGSKLSKNV